MSRGLLGCLSVMSLLAARSAHGATYYTSLAGDDSESCDQAQNEATPKATLHGGAACLAPGDVLSIRGGTYDEEFYYSGIPSGTSWAAPVTLAAYPGEMVVIRPTAGACDGSPCRVFTFVDPQQYVVLDGLVIDAMHVVYDAVKITCSGDCTETAHHIRLQDCEIMNAPGQGILGGTDSEFIRLSVHDNGTTDFDHGIYTSGNNNLIEGCEFYRNAGWGIHKYPAGDNVIIRNNRVHDNARVGERGVGIGIYGGTGNLVYNNLVWGNNGGIFAQYGENGARILANTIYDNLGSGIYNGEDSTGAVVRNNLVFANESDIDNVDPATAVTDNACAAAAEGCSVVGDPNLADPMATPPDLHLLAGSPAIDVGADLSADGVVTDADGASRPLDGDGNGRALFDLGAYEYTGSVGAGGSAGAGVGGMGSSGGAASGPVGAGAGSGASAEATPADGDGGCACRLVVTARRDLPSWRWLAGSALLMVVFGKRRKARRRYRQR